jgi:hypothetical protein
MPTDAMLALALGAALAAALLASLGEWLHARRVARVARLAFGADGRPAAWTAIAPFARVAGLALAAFGATLLSSMIRSSRMTNQTRVRRDRCW